MKTEQKKDASTPAPFNFRKFAREYLRDTGDLGTFFAFRMLWKRRRELPIIEKKQKINAFIYPH